MVYLDQITIFIQHYEHCRPRSDTAWVNTAFFCHANMTLSLYIYGLNQIQTQFTVSFISFQLETKSPKSSVKMIEFQIKKLHVHLLHMTATS